MSFPRYPKYKDSGVEWLGEVPEHWDVKPLKRCFTIVGGSTPASGDESLWDGDIPWATPSDLSALESLYVETTQRTITTSGLQSCGTTLVPAGTGILSTRAPIGSLGIAATELCTNQGCKSLVPHPTADPKYFAYLLSVSTDQLVVRGKGTTFLELSGSELGSFVVPVPDTNTQRLIASFLDRETAKIDVLIAEQQRLIELLQEKRQAVISHAVTKGLNPDAPMKDSGIEWLGEVPEHWQVIPLKRLADIQTGVAKGKDNSGKATISVPYLRVANVQDGYLDLNEVTTIDIPADELPRYSLRAGDVLMNEGGDFDKLGRGCIWEGQLDPCITQNHVFAVRPRCVSAQWLNAITGSGYAQFYFMSRSKQSTNLASISSTNLMELPVILPPNEEQSGVLSFMATQTSLFTSLTAKATQAIALLQERRSALISAAVTGQIDVRVLAGSEAA